MVCTDILLPPQTPAEYQDRATLWNAVEKAERGKKAQLVYSFDIALQNEFSLEENIALARQFVSEQLVNRGMIAGFAIHRTEAINTSMKAKRDRLNELKELLRRSTWLAENWTSTVPLLVKSPFMRGNRSRRGFNRSTRPSIV